MVQRNVNSVLRERGGRALGPLDQRYGAFRQGRQTDLLQLRGIVDAVKVGMDQRERRQFVALGKGEGRAWNLDRIVAGEIADQGARRGGLAGAGIARG